MLQSCICVLLEVLKAWKGGSLCRHSKVVVLTLTTSCHAKKSSCEKSYSTRWYPLICFYPCQNEISAHSGSSIPGNSRTWNCFQFNVPCMLTASNWSILFSSMVSTFSLLTIYINQKIFSACVNIPVDIRHSCRNPSIYYINTFSKCYQCLGVYINSTLRQH